MNISSAFSGPGLFRLALAGLVFVQHATRLTLGTAAVFVFFVLSGYWISTMWTARYSKAPRPYRIYLLSRAWRLLPVFVLCSSITFVLLILKGQPLPNSGLLHLAISHLLLFGYNSLSFQPNVPAWSLDIEAQFYLVAPLLVILMTRSFWTLAGCVTVSLIAWCLSLSMTVAPFLVFFAIGIALSRLQWKPEPRFAWAMLISTFAAVAICILSPFRSVLLAGAHPGPFSTFTDLANLVIAIALVPWAIYTTGQKGCQSDEMLADLSYIVYLLHFPVLQFLDTDHSSSLYRAEAIGETFAIVSVGSVLIWWYLTIRSTSCALNGFLKILRLAGCLRV